jgi:hypothetical protein
MTAVLTPQPKMQFLDANGNPLVGGKLYTYAAGTTTPLATYTTAAAGTSNTNPVILDSRGEANVWLASGTSYKFKLLSSTDVEQWTVDNIASTGTMATQNANLVAITGGTIANVAISNSSYSGTASNVTGTVAVANGGTGATTAAAARTALGAAASGANTDITSLANATSINSETIGYRGLPQLTKTASYTLASADAGKFVSITTGGVVLPANSSDPVPIGTAISIYNNSSSSQTISITTDTLRQAGTANTGSRTLAQYGIATVLKVASTTWIISGAGVT